MGGDFVDGPWFVLVIIAAFVVVFPLIWSFACWVLANVGGWTRAAEHFATDRPAPENADLVGGTFGLVNYRSTLIVGRDGDGLHLSVLSIFRPGHRPLWIPLAQISAVPSNSLFRRCVRLSLGGIAYVKIPTDAWERVRPDTRPMNMG